MKTEPEEDAGIIGSLRTLADALVSSAQDRLELVSIELREERLRLVQTFFWSSAVFLTGGMAATFVSLTLVYVFWESARVAVLGGLAVTYTGLFVALIIWFRRHLARQTSFLAATLVELENDRTCIRGKS